MIETIQQMHKMLGFQVRRTKAEWSHTNGDIIKWEEIIVESPSDRTGTIAHRVWWGYRAGAEIIAYGMIMDDEDAARKLYHDVGLRGWRGNPRFDPTA